LFTADSKGGATVVATVTVTRAPYCTAYCLHKPVFVILY